MKRYMIEDTSSGWRYYQHELGPWCKWDDVDRELKVACKIGTEDMAALQEQITTLTTRAERAEADTVTLADRLVAILEHISKTSGTPWRSSCHHFTLAAIDRAMANSKPSPDGAKHE